LFKNLLDSILYDEENPTKAKQVSVLKNYCNVQSAQDGRGDIISPFPDILQTWSFAEQSNNDALLSSVPAVLALFLKTISSELDFRNFGVALCKTLLQSEQLVLFNRGLTAAKTKEHLISPCIRLLTEIVSFDGGGVAATLFAKRETTFKRLDVFLSMRKELSGDPEEDRRKPSVRNNAVRYLLANLRFQAVIAKVDLLSQGKLWGVVFNDLRADTRDLVIDILVYLEKNVMKNAQITRPIKGKFLNQWNLPKIAALYAYKRDLELKDGEQTVAELVNVFLLSACTDPNNGVLHPQTGWYPPGSHPDAPDSAEENDSLIDLGLDSPSYVDSYREKVPVRNVTLSQFIQGLRPEADTLQMELLLAIFEAAPELVADYFSKKPKFISDPKETPAWLGQSAFLFSTVQLPVPKHGGWRDGLPFMPPATSIVIESVLPRPLTSKTLTRCLTQTSDVITLYGLSVVRRSLQKLAQVLEAYRSSSSRSSRLWQQAASRLITEFCRRCPTMKDVISVFRTTSKENLSLREAVLETLVLYYEVLPRIALEEKFDVSLSLVQVLESLKKPELGGEEKDSMLAQLNYILEIARHSPSVRWWYKPGGLS
jgi:nucleolar pre-ribosomal-associated protein 1